MTSQISNETLKSIKSVEILVKDGFVCRVGVSKLNLVDNILTIFTSSYRVSISGEEWNELNKYPEAISILMPTEDKDIKIREKSASPLITMYNIKGCEYSFFKEVM